MPVAVTLNASNETNCLQCCRRITSVCISVAIHLFDIFKYFVFMNYEQKELGSLKLKSKMLPDLTFLCRSIGKIPCLLYEASDYIIFVYKDDYSTKCATREIARVYNL